VATFGRRFIRKCVAPILIFSVPKGCSTVYRRGLKQPQVGPDLYAREGMLMFWSHTPVAPWQDEKWIEEMRRSLRPNAYARLVLNEFASSESSFIDMSAWDACVNPNLTPAPPDKSLHIWVGVDASVKRDSTALIAVTIDKKSQMLRLVHHRVLTPTPDEPINFEDTIERTILAWKNQYALRKIWFDPYQMAAVAQRLTKMKINVEEYPQTLPNLTAATRRR
jgi:phage terminase large subunit-like protein